VLSALVSSRPDVFYEVNTMTRTRATIGCLALFVAMPLTGCDAITGLMGGDDGSAAYGAGEASLRQGDLPAAADQWEQAQVANPGNVDIATGAAYSLLLKGDTDAADAALAAAEATAGDRLPEIKLRRALVALEAGNLDVVGQHARASGLPAGKLLAAEVALADGETDDAIGLLQGIRSAGGSVGSLASRYLELLESDDPMVAGLCEAEALWALGVRKVAVQSADELVRGLPDDLEEKPELLLTWAGRAASVRESEIASGMLAPLTFPPEGMKWRMDAVQAMVHCIDGELDECQSLFDKVDKIGPGAGVADARATAAYLIADEHPDVAKALVSGIESNAAARALLETGDAGAAKQASPGGVIDTYLDAGG
jgi:tetratricopeptide (TPR) repeat protein